MAKKSSSVAAQKGGMQQIEDSYNACMPFETFKTWVSAYFRPVDVFNAEKKKAEGMEIAKTFASIGLISAIVVAIVTILSVAFNLGSMAGLAFGLGELAVAIIAALILYPIIMTIIGFILSGIYFVIAKLLGGKGEYMEQTLGIALITGGYILLMAPLQILSLIPIIGVVFSVVILIIGLYSLYSQYRLVKEVHGLSSFRAALVIIIPVAVLFLLALVVIGSLAMAGAGSAMAGGY